MRVGSRKLRVDEEKSSGGLGDWGRGFVGGCRWLGLGVEWRQPGAEIGNSGLEVGA